MRKSNMGLNSEGSTDMKDSQEARDKHQEATPFLSLYELRNVRQNSSGSENMIDDDQEMNIAQENKDNLLPNTPVNIHRH
jgi:hypothetical protein